MDDPIVTSNIFAPNYSVTGIRSEDKANKLVLMTGSCPIPNTSDTKGMLYRGLMNPKDSSGCICLLPKGIPGVTTSIFYGPDTPLFTPGIGQGNVRVVGSYRCGEGYDQGVLYEGPPDGSGNYWKTLNMDAGVAGGAVANTILHSTMGELIVGNYDLQGIELGKFNAFIYNIRTGKYQDLKSLLQLDSGKLITAYGIWQHDIGSTSYTIAGGLWDKNIGLNVGYLVDYDSVTSNTSHLTKFRYDDAPDLITHFEGITKYGEEMTELFGPRYYSLAATGDKNKNDRGAAFAVVKRKDDGSFFDEAEWQRVPVLSSGFTTGNTVLTNNLYGIYTTGNGIQSYVAENLTVADVEAEG